MKFKIKQAVRSPFGIVEVICRWRGKDTVFYDVKYLRQGKIETWTFEEPELMPLSLEGIASK